LSTVGLLGCTWWWVVEEIKKGPIHISISLFGTAECRLKDWKVFSSKVLRI
jgi:hypothetical protein